MLAFVLAPALPARAENDTWVSPGVALALAKADPVFGAELSFVRTPGGIPILWYGLYADALYDAGAKRLRAGLGPEIGVGPLGLDTSLVVQSSGHVGVSVRALLGVGFLFGYVRWIYADDPRLERGSALHELGLLAKLPVPFEEHRPPTPPPPPKTTPTQEPRTSPHVLPRAVSPRETPAVTPPVRPEEP